jgi:hypothetical protein
MHNITLISTSHRELGKCNSDELYKIIESIRPDMIFEELPHDLFELLYMGDQIPIEQPEIKTVMRYLQNHSIKHIPVDIHINSNLSEREINYMLDTFKKYDVHKKIEDEQKNMIASDGFTFLNSKYYEELFEKKMKIEKYLIAIMNIKQLLRIHKLFYEEQDNREHGMLKIIYNYSKQHIYENAIFTLGAGHRKSIIQKIQEYDLKEKFKLNWTFYNV